MTVDPIPAEAATGVVRLDGATVPPREEIGNKAASLARMRALGLPVPPAFVLPTTVGRRFTAERELPDDVWASTLAALADLETETGRRLGDPDAPLLLSVRSGAAESMPGMMDTILDLGIDDRIEAGLARVSGDPGFARDSHRRFVESYARCVFGIRPPSEDPAEVLDPTSAPARLRARVAELVGRPVPEDPCEQLRAAIVAVLRSWSSPRAIAYRDRHGIAHDGGTAVTVQAMVYGNLDDRSGTGVLFTRNPQTGARAPMGEFLPRGQGEDVVSGEVDPLDLAELAARMPSVHEELLAAGRTLEEQAGDVQDIEFTVERGQLYLLQARTAKRAPRAALRIAVDLVDDGVLTPREALDRIRAEHVTAVLRPELDAAARAGARVLATGTPAGPGIGSGRAVGSPDEAALLGGDGTGDDADAVVLVRHCTSPEDIHGMFASRAVVTEVGGRTSHAAVVGREMGLPTVVGCGEGVVAALEGREITVDGTTGEVLDGILAVRVPDTAEIPGLDRLLGWAREHPDVVAAGHPLTEVASR